MINRQAMRGAGTNTTSKAPPRAKLTKEAGARSSVKTNGKAEGRGPATKGAMKRTSWRGEEVSSTPAKLASSAEDAASRAEGNAPVRADVAARDRNPGTYTEKGPARRPRANDPDVVENEEEKRRSAAEDHATQSSRHFPYGRL